MYTNVHTFWIYLHIFDILFIYIHTQHLYIFIHIHSLHRCIYVCICISVHTRYVTFIHGNFQEFWTHAQLEVVLMLCFPHCFFTPKAIEVNQHAVASLLYLKEKKIVWTLMLVLKAMSSLQLLNRRVIGGQGWLLSVNILLVTPAASWQYLLHRGCFLITHFQCPLF